MRNNPEDNRMEEVVLVTPPQLRCIIGTTDQLNNEAVTIWANSDLFVCLQQIEWLHPLILQRTLSGSSYSAPRGQRVVSAQSRLSKEIYSARPISRGHFSSITHEIHPCIARKCETWVSFMSSKSGRNFTSNLLNCVQHHVILYHDISGTYSIEERELKSLN